MGVVQMGEAAQRRAQQHAPSRAACYVCGLSEDASIHGSDVWWQHQYEPGILTRRVR